MKFYYNGKLLRTSETHTYTHAVINGAGKCVGCRTSQKAAQYIIDYEVNQCRQGIENCKAAIKALESGKSYYTVKSGRRTYPHKFQKDDTIESYADYIDGCEKRIDYILRSWKVVELETVIDLH